jgi:hypothetical protein
VGPGDFRAAFTAAEGWGTFAQQRGADGLHATVDVKWGQLALRTFGLAATGTGVRVTLGDQTVAATVAFDGGRATVAFASPVVVSAGARLAVHVA